jgi:phosphoribosylaminoimidazole (AIR) synthetase
MGVGMVVCVAPAEVDAVLAKLAQLNEAGFIIGDVVKNPDGGLIYA